MQTSEYIEDRIAHLYQSGDVPPHKISRMLNVSRREIDDVIDNLNDDPWITNNSEDKFCDTY